MHVQTMVHTSFGNFTHRNLLLICHEAQDGENHKSSKNGCGTVEYSNQKSISVAIVGEFVEATHSNQTTGASRQRVEYLSGCIIPHLGEWTDF